MTKTFPREDLLVKQVPFLTFSLLDWKFFDYMLYCTILPKGPGYCYMFLLNFSIRNFQKTTLLISFWYCNLEKGMSLVVFDIECLEGKIVKKLGVFKDGIVFGIQFPATQRLPTYFSSKVEH